MKPRSCIGILTPLHSQICTPGDGPTLPVRFIDLRRPAADRSSSPTYYRPNHLRLCRVIRVRPTARLPRFASHRRLVSRDKRRVATSRARVALNNRAQRAPGFDLWAHNRSGSTRVASRVVVVRTYQAFFTPTSTNHTHTHSLTHTHTHTHTLFLLLPFPPSNTLHVRESGCNEI